MPTPDLGPLLFPRRIAIAGLSNRPGTWGQMSLEGIRQGGFDGEIVALRARNPVDGVTVVSSLADAGRVDVLMVALPAGAAVEAVAEAAAADVGSVIVYSSGFAEEGGVGEQLQESLAEAAGTLPMLGPNCLGVLSVPGKLRLSPSSWAKRSHGAGPVALVTQSGAVGYVLADHLGLRGVGFSYYVSTGNEATLSAPDVAAGLVERPDVSVVGMYLEGVRDHNAYRRLCVRTAELGKHLVVLKVGRTAAAKEAARSHTAAVAGEWPLFEAMSRDHGVTLVDNEEEFAEAVHLLGRPVALPARPRLGVVTASGGGGAMIADQTSRLADIRPLSEATRAEIEKVDIPLAGARNPIDLSGMYYRYFEGIDKLLEVLAADEEIDALVVYMTFGDRFISEIRSMASRLEDLPVPAWMVWAAAPEGVVASQSKLARVLPSIPAFARALRVCPRELPRSVVDLFNRFRLLAPAGPHSLYSSQLHSLRGREGIVSEREAAPVLSAFGLPYVDMVAAQDGDELAVAVEKHGLQGPFVVKFDHPDVPHRASLGLVEMGVAGGSGIRDSAARIWERALTAGIPVDGARFVAETQLEPVGSFSIGALWDASVGPVLVVGPGGAGVEEANSGRAMATLPLRPAGFGRLLESAIAFGGPALVADEAAKAILAVASAVENLPSLEELDVNPLLVMKDGTLRAVDALLVVSEKSHEMVAG